MPNFCIFFLNFAVRYFQLLTIMRIFLFLLFCLPVSNPSFAKDIAATVSLFPVPNSREVCIDTHLRVMLPEGCEVGKKGFIRIYDLTARCEADCLDLSLPAGPTVSQPNNPSAIYTPVPYTYRTGHITNRNTLPGTPSGAAAKSADIGRYQLTIIGGFSDGFHFYPMLVRGREAVIYLHHNVLEYGHQYEVRMDKDVFPKLGRLRWRFTTKVEKPKAEGRIVDVNADGTADFATVQGALDFIPDSLPDENARMTVRIANGDYEELVYFRNKRFVTLEGQSREGVIIHYPNNEVFNPHPADIKTNELKGTFPSRRAAFAADNCHDMVFRNLTLRTDCHGQAEGFLLNGERNFVENVHVIGSGDALQTNGSAYFLNCIIDGEGDTILGRGAAFFNHCSLSSIGPFMWIRNTEENHGNVFLDCSFRGIGKGAVIARLLSNHGKNYPHAEAVLLNCTLDNIPSSGFFPVAEEARTATLLEFNSHTPDGNPVDVSGRHPVVRQLHPVRDAQLIAKYSDWRFVLKCDSLPY